MNFMSIYANIYNWTRPISKFFLFYLSMLQSCSSCPRLSYINYGLKSIFFFFVLSFPFFVNENLPWQFFIGPLYKCSRWSLIFLPSSRLSPWRVGKNKKTRTSDSLYANNHYHKLPLQFLTVYQQSCYRKTKESSLAYLVFEQKLVLCLAWNKNILKW